MRISVFGLGYVGLATAVGFALKGHQIAGFDPDKNKIKTLKSGKLPFFEEDMEKALRSVQDKIFFTDSPQDALKESNVVFLCVGTPSLPDGRADLSQVEAAARTIAGLMEDYLLVVVKSTVPVGTAQWIKRTIKLYQKKEFPFDVASNPEFLREGRALEDFLHPDRIVIGTESSKARQILEEIYKDFDAPKIFTNPQTAELIKYASNAFLATKISFINMVSDLCEKVGADVTKVAEAMGMDKRIGRQFLNAGIGFGGSCFPKDLKAFYSVAKDHGVDFSLIQEVERINERRITVLLHHIRQALWVVKEKKIALWGLSFKPGTDDIREAPSLKVIKELLRNGAILALYDPKAMERTKEIYPPDKRIIYCKDMYEAVRGAFGLIILTEWEDFKKADLQRVKQLMVTPIVVDGRNLYDPSYMEKLGFEYFSIGRPPVMRSFSWE